MTVLASRRAERVLDPYAAKEKGTFYFSLREGEK
jgi:hypothetical protein